MSPRRTRRGTVRESVCEVSVDTSLNSNSKILRTTRRTNKNQTVKASEDESDSPVEVNSLVGNVTATSFSNEISINTRKRRRKAEEITLNQDISLSGTIDESKTNSHTNKSNLKTQKHKRQTKNIKSQTIDSNSFISENESFNVKNQKDVKRVSYSIDNSVSEDEEISQASSRKKVKSDNQCKTPAKLSRKTSLTNVKSSEEDVTPKNSPINISFSPHRSKKTPRKSPINLGSPKTHSRNSFKLLNVPRKLSIVDSPPSSDKSNNSLQQQNSSIIVNESIKNTSKSHKNSKSIKNKSTSPTLKIRPRFSKSPKIVFRTPKSKSTKSSKKSPKKSPNASPSKSKKLSKTNTSLTESKIILEAISPRKSKESLQTDSPLKFEKTPTDISPVKSKKSPKIVMLSKSKMSPKSGSSNKSVKASNFLLKSQKSPKAISPVKSTKSPKITISVKSQNSPKPISPVKSTKSPKVTLSVKSQKSPKRISSVKSTKSPKVILSVKSQKSPFETSLKSKTSSNLISPSKSKKSPAVLSLSSKKMPKIVLSLKSKKSPLKSKKSPLKSKKSPLKSATSVSPSKFKKSPLKSPKNISPPKVKKSPKKVSPTVKPSSRKSIVNNNLSKKSLSPRVIINKLSTPQLKNSTLNITEKQPSINLVPIDHKDHLSVTPNYQKGSTHGVKSPKSPKFLGKRSVIKAASPAKARTQINTSKKINKSNLSLKNSTPSDVLERKLLNLKPANTSTPREKTIKRTLTVASNKEALSPKGSPISKSKVIKRLNSQSIKIDHPLLEDESEPSMNDSSLIHMSDVFDSDNSQKNNTFELNKSGSNKRKSINHSNVSQKGNKSSTFEINKNSSSSSTKGKSKKNDTYELEHPKTPGLQKKSRKRTLDEAELGTNEEQESKKTCRVHFASPSLRNQVQSSGINRMGTPGHVIQQKRTPVSISKIKTTINKVEIKKRVSLVSIPQIKITASTPVNTKQSNILSDTSLKSRKSNHESQTASVNRLSRPKGIMDSEKKLGTKTPVATKIPNFAKIHQKNFAKMESLIDLKKRVEKRHVTLNDVTNSTKKTHPPEHLSGSNKPIPPDSKNGAYSRFGFKLRKNDAVNIISKKQTGSVDSREKKREDARSALKGVRMNRRFELQMKSRTKNT